MSWSKTGRAAGIFRKEGPAGPGWRLALLAGALSAPRLAHCPSRCPVLSAGGFCSFCPLYSWEGTGLRASIPTWPLASWFLPLPAFPAVASAGLTPTTCCLRPRPPPPANLPHASPPARPQQGCLSRQTGVPLSLQGRPRSVVPREHPSAALQPSPHARPLLSSAEPEDRGPPSSHTQLRPCPLPPHGSSHSCSQHSSRLPPEQSTRSSPCPQALLSIWPWQPVSLEWPLLCLVEATPPQEGAQMSCFMADSCPGRPLSAGARLWRLPALTLGRSHSPITGLAPCCLRAGHLHPAARCPALASSITNKPAFSTGARGGCLTPAVSHRGESGKGAELSPGPTRAPSPPAALPELPSFVSLSTKCWADMEK